MTGPRYDDLMRLGDSTPTLPQPGTRPSLADFERMSQDPRTDYELWKNDFLEARGMRTGAWRGIAEMVLDTGYDITNTTGADLAAGVSGAGQGFKEFAGQVVDDPISAGSGVIVGMYEELIKNPVELAIDSELSTGRQLTPEERSYRGKSAAANMMGILLGVGVSKYLAARMIGQESVAGSKLVREMGRSRSAAENMEILTKGDLSARDLMLLANTEGRASFAPSIGRVADLTGGAVEGFTSGYLQGNTPEERINAGLVYAAVAAPFGVAAGLVGKSWEMVRGMPANKPLMIAQHAGVQAQLKQLHDFQSHAPVMQMLVDMDNLAEYGDIGVALAAQGIEYRKAGKALGGKEVKYGANATVIPGQTSPAKILEIVAKRNADWVQYPQSASKPFDAIVHANEAGTFDILIAPNDMRADAIKTFEQSGFLDGQQVVHQGTDNWYIDGVNKKDGTFNLRHRVTNEVLENIDRADIVRPASMSLGDVFVMQKRMLASGDIFDLGQGYTKRGLFDIDTDAADFVGMDTPDIIANLDMWSRSYEEIIFGATGMDMQPDAMTGFRPVKRGDKIFLSNGQEIKPGINKWEGFYPAGNKHGFVYFVGGEMDVRVPDGKGGYKVEKKMVGEEGRILSLLEWEDHKNWRGGWDRRSHNAFAFQGLKELDIDAYKFMGEEVRRVRAEDNIFKSGSSLSKGGAEAVRRLNNTLGSPRGLARFGYMNPDVFMRELYQGFLDHVGFTGKQVLASPSEIITRVGIADGSIASVNRKMIGQPGQTHTRLLDELPSNLGVEVSQHATRGKRFYSEIDPNAKTRTELTAWEAVDELKAQMDVDAVPLRRNPTTGAIDRRQLTFADMVKSFMLENEMNPALTSQISDFLVDRMGKELIGDASIRGRYVDKNVQLPLLFEQIGIFKKDLVAIDKVLETPGITEAQKVSAIESHKELAAAIDILERRVEHLKDETPPSLSPEDLETFRKLKKEVEVERSTRAKTLIHRANSSGYVVERNANGAIKLRDIETNELVGSAFVDDEAAKLWLSESGRQTGVDLDGGDGGNIVPPRGVIGDMIDDPGQPPGQHMVPFEFAPNTRVGKMINLFDATVPWYTPKRAAMVAFDNLFGTKFYEDVYLPLQIAKLTVESRKRGALKNAQDIEQILIKANIPRERWALLSDNLETASIDEIKTSFYRNRPLTPQEIGFAQKLADRKIDIRRIFRYKRALEQIETEFRNNAGPLKMAADNGDLAAGVKFKQLDDQRKIDIDGLQQAELMDPDHLKASMLFDRIKSMPLKEATINAVTTLAEALQNPHTALTQAEHAARHKLSSAELQARDKLREAFSQVARDNGIDESITRYFSHYRQYGELPSSDFRKHDNPLGVQAQKTGEFVSRLVRTGEMSLDQMSRDPIKVLVQYANAAFNETHFNDAWTTAHNKANEHLKAIPQGRTAVARVVSEYVDGLRGAPAAGDELTQGAMNAFFDDMGIKTSVDVRKGFVNTFLAATSGAMLGFRPAQAVRDMVSFFKVYYVRFGSARFANGMELAFKRDANGISALRNLAEDGRIPGLSILSFVSDDELSNALTSRSANKLKELIHTASKRGLELSGQSNVYSLAHAIAYLDTRDVVSKALSELTANKITKAAAYKRMKLNSYDLPVAEGFDRLVTAGKMDDAVEYLAHSTGIETAFMYGMQNHPYGWGSLVGRLAGQFGTWSMWSRNHLARVATRGTMADRAAAIARFGASEAGTLLMGRVLGFNVGSWMMLPGIAFMGGPAIDMAQDLYAATGAEGKLRQDLAQSRIKDGKVPFISNLVPGAYALADYIQAYELMKKNYGPVAVIGKALGFSIDKENPSFIDIMTGNRPRQ